MALYMFLMAYASGRFGEAEYSLSVLPKIEFTHEAVLACGSTVLHVLYILFSRCGVQKEYTRGLALTDDTQFIVGRFFAQRCEKTTHKRDTLPRRRRLQ